MATKTPKIVVTHNPADSTYTVKVGRSNLAADLPCPARVSAKGLARRARKLAHQAGKVKAGICASVEVITK
jgi:hypothetical protein